MRFQPPITPLCVCAFGLLVGVRCSKPNTPVSAPAVATASSPPPATASAASAVAQSPADRQFAAWLAAFNGGNRDDLLACHEQFFPYSAASEDVSTIDHEMGLGISTGGFDVKKTESGPNSITVTMKERHSSQFARVTMEVDPAEPHRVVRFEIHPIPTPDEFLSDEERDAFGLDAQKRAALIDAMVRDIRAHYVIPAVGDKLIAMLNDRLSHGGYDSMAQGLAFATLVTIDLRAASHDGHIELEFGPPRERPGVQPQKEQRAPLGAASFLIGPIERLPGNVAHMFIDGFVHPSDEAKDAIAGLMTQIADADALVLDLRHNQGGDPRTVALVASYLFDATPVHLNDFFRRDTGQTEPSWTLRDVKGTRFGSKKPVYVLTSHRTFSGGEELAYDLQALRRAVIVGETTGGGAHTTDVFDLDDWFHFVLPVGRPINPITKTDWEGVGVKPDVAVSDDAALEAARRRALADIANKKRSH